MPEFIKKFEYKFIIIKKGDTLSLALPLHQFLQNVIETIL